MSDNENVDATDEMLNQIFEHASPRPVPSGAAQEEAFESLRQEWLELTAKRRARRRIAVWGIAASFAIAAFLGYRTLDVDVAPSTDPVAEIARISGDSVLVNGRGIDKGGATSGIVRLAPGDSLATGDASQVAIAWRSASSLRLDRNSQIEIVSGEVVRFSHGAVYFDSQQFGQSADPNMKFSVETSFGRISHIGTQFMLRMDQDKLAVSVREGSVQLEGSNVSVTVRNGEIKTLYSNGDFSQGSIGSFDEQWGWATEIAPVVQLGGQNWFEVLSWVGRETGRKVMYGADAERRAQSDYPHGLDSLSPSQALATIPVMTDLKVRQLNDRIIVE